ncbi:hypothetical protein MFUL124B02_16410 [Myxococcus fulvus 124B02]|nr:hypothetical protein MFUL124B02_16410 [Myxococcus fulvus 124B02]
MHAEGVLELLLRSGAVCLREGLAQGVLTECRAGLIEAPVAPCFLEGLLQGVPTEPGGRILDSSVLVRSARRGLSVLVTDLLPGRRAPRIERIRAGARRRIPRRVRSDSAARGRLGGRLAHGTGELGLQERAEGHCVLGERV